MLGFPGHHRDELDTGRPGTDDADPLAGQVDHTVGPPAGVQRRTREAVHPGDRGFQRHREDSGGRDDERRGHHGTRFGVHGPLGRLFAVGHGHDGGVEVDLASQVEPVGHEVEIGLDLGLGGHGLRPHPLLLDLFGERVGVLDALDVTPGSGVAVDQPGAADRVCLLQHADPQTEFAQMVQCIETGEPGADNDHVEACDVTVDRHCSSDLDRVASARLL